MLDEWQRIGLLLTGLGVLFLFLGILLIFDRTLLAFGNLLFVSGVTLVIGPNKTMSFFFQARKIKGTSCFIGGIFLVLLGWTIIGMLVEIFGFINLFGYFFYQIFFRKNSMLIFLITSDFFPIILVTARRLPVIGQILEIPFLKRMTDSI